VIAVVVAALLVVAEIVVAGSRASKQAAGTSDAPQNQPLAPMPADGVTASTPLAENSGTRVYSDLFGDPGSGWIVDDEVEASTHYVSDGYAMTVTGHENWFSLAPYAVPAQQVLLSMRATESGDSTGRAGFGLLCVRGPRSDGLLRYEFVVNGTGHWSIERNEGPVSLTAPPSVLDEGTASQAAGATPAEITAVCATLADGQTTRLVFFVHGVEVADITDVGSADGAGWIGGMISSGASDETSTAEADAFSENRLGLPAQAGSNA